MERRFQIFILKILKHLNDLDLNITLNNNKRGMKF